MHTNLCILLVLTGCVYAATDDSNSTSSSNLTTTTQSPTTTTTAIPSTTSTTSTTLRPPGPPLRPPRPPGPRGPPGRLVPPQQLPIPQIVNQGIRIADNIAKTIFGNLVPSPPPGNRGGPNPRRPRAVAFSVTDPLKMMSLNGSLTGPSFSNMVNFPMPNIDDMVPDILQSSSNYSDIDIPKISSYENPASTYVPGVQDALDQVHEMISNELQPGADMPEAIQTAMQDILASDNPTDGLRELCSMVMNAYRTVAERCPLFIAKKCVLAEGLRCVQNMINIIEYLTSQE